MNPAKRDIKEFLYTPGKYLKIPDFQRPYSWDKPNIAAFLNDLEEAIRKDRKHFFGSIVFINEGDNSTIIDGQQRATTVLLMLTAIYHILIDDPKKSSINASEIQEKYLYNTADYYEEKNRIKLRTVTSDNEIFEQIYNRKGYSPKSKDSRLYQAYEYFYDYFCSRDNLEKYVKGLEMLEIVSITLEPTDDNPQRIFESINSTGKPLTDGDKIRNFALMLNNPQARQVVLDDYWKVIEKELTDINKDYISDFFRYYLTSRLQREVKIERVYPEFKELFALEIGDQQDNIAKLETFYGDVLNYLYHYVFLKFNRDDKQRYKLLAAKSFRLNFLKIETPFPYLMRVLEDYRNEIISEREVLEILTILESYLVRRIICSIPTTGLNKFFATLYKDIKSYLTKYQKSHFAEIFKYLLISREGDLRFPNEAEIKNAVENNPFYNQRYIYINFVLTSIDDASKESKLLKQISSGDKDLSIEHVMPQTLSSTWKADLGPNYADIHQRYLHTLPNLTLTGYNSKYSNSDFSKKKTIEHGFNDSPLIINQYFKKIDQWDENAMIKRKKWWLGKIARLWPIPTSDFLPEINQLRITLADAGDLTNTRIKGIAILGEESSCTNWAEAIDLILTKFFSIETSLYDKVLNDEFLHRYIKTTDNGLRKPKPIEGTSYYYETNTNTNIKRDMLIRLAEYLEIDKTEVYFLLPESENR